MSERSTPFLAGLFLTTAAMLLLELLDTRLLSVLTWYHLSFFAVSTAMFGLAAGAVRVYLAGEAYAGDAAPNALARNAGLLAVAIPLCHVVNLSIPLRPVWGLSHLLAMALSIAALAVPFYLAGTVVAIALTRVPAPTGRVYAVDLLGAAAGCLLIVPLLDVLSLPSVMLLCGALAAAGAACFHRFAGGPGARRWLLIAAALVFATVLNQSTPRGLRVIFPKSNPVDMAGVTHEYWTIHGQITARAPVVGPPRYWGPGKGWRRYQVRRIDLLIDGGPWSPLTEWDGDPQSLRWVEHDVTSLPYQLRKGGDVAVIGVGGGRDLLTAIHAGSRSVLGIEVNDSFLEILGDEFRSFAKIADHPTVRLVHDEARSYLTRSDERFDVLQMSLIDTFAATGAGAFTLSENGLYTVEGWDVFLERLAPGGLFSVSRWFSREHASETSRLLSLATAALISRGVERPAEHLALVSRARIATLLVSNQPLSRADVAAIEAAAKRFEFEILLAPGHAAAVPELHAITASGTPEALALASAHPDYDYTPPTDARPYFFNILKPERLFGGPIDLSAEGVILDGNLEATATLLVLLGLAITMVVGVVIVPLVRSGTPDLDGGTFSFALAYFGLIGAGYMLVQIPLIQRLTVYLGHPSYTVPVVLFAMILASGIGSWLSDRLPVEARREALIGVPVAVSVLLVAVLLTLQPLIDATIRWSLLPRCLTAAAVAGTLGLPLGMCFPTGLRVVRRISDEVTPWLWGVNGALGVLASVSAVAISMWFGIDASLRIAVGCYLLLLWPATVLWRRLPAAGLSPARRLTRRVSRRSKRTFAR